MSCSNYFVTSRDIDKQHTAIEIEEYPPAYQILSYNNNPLSVFYIAQ